VLKTSALRSEGIEELLAAIEEHRKYQLDTGLREFRERVRATDELRRILRHDLLAGLLHRIAEADLEDTVTRIIARQEDPYTAAERLIAASGLEGV
jgi:LAO/AO transport system kinase